LKLLSIDTEGPWGIFNPWERGFYLSCVGLAFDENQHKMIWFEHNKQLPTVRGIPTLQKYIDEADLIIAHNWKYDLNSLRSYGVNFDNAKLWCTMVAEYLLNGQNKKVSLSLKDLANRYNVGEKFMEINDDWNKGVDTKDIVPDILEKRVLVDAQLALQIYERQRDRAETYKMVRLIELQSEYIKVLSDIESNGFIFDVDRATKIINGTNQQIEDLESEFRELVGEPHLNVASPAQRSAVLYGGKLKIKYRGIKKYTYKTKPEPVYREAWIEDEHNHPGLGFVPSRGTKLNKNGYYPTGNDYLAQLRPGKDAKRKRAVEILLDLMHLMKLKTSLQGKDEDKGLINHIAPDGYVHSRLNNTVTTTGRLSSSNPNQQNFPRKGTSPIKQCIIPRYDGIYQVDLSQIEWRGAACLSHDEVMIHEINNKIDQHAKAVTDFMELKFTSKSDPESKQNRQDAKVFNFRMIYGGSSYGYYKDPNMPNFSKKKWDTIVDRFHRKYTGLAKYNEDNIAHVLSHGQIQIPTGRRFVFNKFFNKKEGVETYNEKQIKNFPVQGIAGGDVLPLMAVIIRRGLIKHGLESKLILTVHDSLVFDYILSELVQLNKLCLETARNLPRYINQFFGFQWCTRIDVESEIGTNYGDLKYYDETK